MTYTLESWRPNAIYRLGDRVTLRDEHAIFVLRCEKAGKGGPHAPTIVSAITQNLRSTTLVKVRDVHCEWRLERVICKA